MTSPVTSHLAQLPEIVYKVEKYEVTGERAQVSRTMTIQTQSQPLTVPVTLKPTVEAWRSRARRAST